MENAHKAGTLKLENVDHFGSPVRHFFRFLFGEGITLLDARKAYFDSESGIRSQMHNDYGKGEWLADLVDTGKSAVSPNGYLKVDYVQGPHSGDERADDFSISGGKRISYNCPPTGWVVPDGDLLWHPETGAALATVNSRIEGVEMLAKYIEKHPEQFKGWELPEKSYARFFEMFGGRCNPEKPTPKQLAELELSYQWAPDANSGARTVRRTFDKHCGPFCIYMTDDLNGRHDNTGFRLRTRA